MDKKITEFRNQVHANQKDIPFPPLSDGKDRKDCLRKQPIKV